jgi:predicted nucleotidyltransferase component of viral defense system
MKEYLKQLVSGAGDPIAGRNQAREYLQARILESLQRSGAMIPLAFHGGTALRFLYGLDRFSEDLDFALERPSDAYNLQKFLTSIQSDLSRENYPVKTRLRDEKTVHSAYVDFPGLPYELGLSPHSNEETLSVKIEVDTAPPQGAVLETTLVRRHVILRLQHHDRASLLAGKIHALLQRSTLKGRDLYDLLWYLGDPDWPPPNFQLLQHALAQTGWQGSEPGPDTWKATLCDFLQGIDWQSGASDVRPFLETSGNADLITWENFKGLLGCD